jgi:hypothetical protein
VLAASSTVTLVVVLVVALRATGGTFTYAIDDAAIHLTLARNLVHGTFGIVPGTYQSASSAPLWELLLAPFLAISRNAWWAPLLLNLVALGWLIRSFGRIATVQRMVRAPLGLLAVAALPIGLGWIPLVLIGMEHTMHAAVFVQLLVWLDARVRGTIASRAAVAWYVLIALAALLRFETMFVAIGLALALLLAPDPRRRAALGTLVAAALPIVGFAALNRALGQYALPNSVVAKTALGTGSLLPSVDQVVTRFTDDPLLLLLTIVAAVLLVIELRRPKDRREHRLASSGLVAGLTAVALHLCFADVGWFERYQAYLVIGLAWSILTVASDLERPRWGVAPVAVAVVVLSLFRVSLLAATPHAQLEIYEMQYHVGQFLSQAYGDQPIAVGDIGYVGWFHQGDLVDTAGLGSFDVLAARKDGRWGPQSSSELFDQHGVQALAEYDVYFGHGGQQAGFSKVATWCVQEPRSVLSDRCVGFYARDGEGVDRLRDEMQRYAGQLPDGVTLTFV